MELKTGGGGRQLHPSPNGRVDERTGEVADRREEEEEKEEEQLKSDFKTRTNNPESTNALNQSNCSFKKNAPDRNRPSLKLN